MDKQDVQLLVAGIAIVALDFLALEVIKWVIALLVFIAG